MKTYLCKHCGKEAKHTNQKMNVYCSNKCAGEGKLLESIERAKQGLVSNRPTLRRVLTLLRGYECAECHIDEYNKLPIVLQVDHIDGDASNNDLDNLRLLCPNCHSQQSTWGGGNKGNGRKAKGLPLY